jgi:hypothetical protein
MKYLLILAILIPLIGCEKLAESVSEFDATAPAVIITYPIDKQVIGDSVVIAADATDNSAVSSVSFFIDGAFIGSDTLAPFFYTWKTAFSDASVPHTIYAKAQDKSGNNGLSTLLSVTISPDASRKPELLIPSNNLSVDTSMVRFAWKKFPAAQSYEIEVSQNDNIVATQSIVDTSYTGVFAIGKYSWKIRAVNGNGSKSSWSSLYGFTIIEKAVPPPLVPQLILPLNNAVVTSDTVLFSWSKISGAINYEIELYAGSIKTSSVSTADTFIVHKVSAGQNIWRVRSYNTPSLASGWSSSRSIYFAKPSEGLGVTFGGGGSDYFYSGMEDDNNAYVFAGYSGAPSAGMMVVKTDLALHQLTSKSISGGKNEIANRIIRTNDNNYILVGYTSANNEDGYIAKTDNQGNVLWTKLIGGIGSDNIKSICTDVIGNFYAVGYSSSNSNGLNDGWVIKMSPSGDIIFNKVFGTSSDEGFTDVIMNNDGSIQIVGYAFRQIEYDAWMLRLNPEGFTVYSRHIGSDLREWAGTVRHSPDGGYYIVGQTYSGYGSSDGWIAKTDAAGYQQWTKNYGTSGYDLFTCAQVDLSGDIFIGGYIANGFEKNAWGLRLSPSGAVVWEKQYGGADSDDIYSCFLSKNGKLIYSGSSYSFGNGRQGYVLLVDPVTGALN